jgi:tRNA 5-methylaminomethyl-2-thiouridine biosynthesis bifunctional protein
MPALIPDNTAGKPLASITEFRSSLYDDVYFSAADPEAEKQYVFVEGNDVNRKLRSQNLVVAELGFGFGLNCALALAAARKHQTTSLTYLSVDEKLPDNADVVKFGKTLRRCGIEYEEIWSAIARSTPDAAGWLNITLGPNQVRIYLGDVADFLGAISDHVDVWYLDGFSPQKNPQMWSSEITAAIYSHTKPGGTFSTYTAAGWVRRNLSAAGFEVHKKTGFGNKREMLTGIRR